MPRRLDYQSIKYLFRNIEIHTTPCIAFLSINQALIIRVSADLNLTRLIHKKIKIPRKIAEITNELLKLPSIICNCNDRNIPSGINDYGINDYIIYLTFSNSCFEVCNQQVVANNMHLEPY